MAASQDVLPSGSASARSAWRRSSLRPVAWCAAAVLVLLGIALAYLMYGAINLSAVQVVKGLTSEDADLLARPVVWDIRLPRLVDAMLVGAALAVSGSLLQGVTRNPLADPTLFGISAAAALSSTALLTIDRNAAPWLATLFAVGGGVAGAAILFVIAWRGAVSPVRLALAGVAMSAFFGALIVALLASSTTFLQTSLGYLAGGLYGAGWADFRAMLPYLVPAFMASIMVSGRLNVLALGDDVAAGLGVLTDRSRFAVLAIAGVLAATAVSVAGLVSFVGLLCPHLARFAVGSDNRYRTPVAGLFGAIVVAAADLFARLVVAPAEIPMGVVTAAIGAPFLLFLVKFRQ